MRLLDKICRKYLRQRGYVVSRQPSRAGEGDYFVHEYKDAADRFDYERYRSIQIEGNRKKLQNVYTDRETLALICDFIRTKPGKLERGLCHGSRNGTEIRWFRELLGIDVIGTDISDTASQFPDMTQWDFHEVNPEWAGRFDFVYTNSHDHAYDPKKALDAWVGQLAPDGMLILEHTADHAPDRTSELDPFGVSPNLLPYVVLRLAQGAYCVTRMLELRHKRPTIDHTWVFVIQRTGLSPVEP